MSLTLVLLILATCVVFIIISTSVFKLHPFVSLVLVSIGAGFAFGFSGHEIVSILSSGFGNILAYIGVVIVLGSVLGELLEKSGGAQVIANSILNGFGARNPQLALSSLGAIVGVPVFCDTGFIILSRLTNSIAKAKGFSPKKLSVGLAAGLYTTHTLIPPTPGPIAASGNLGISDYLGIVMLLGLGITIPVIFISYLAIQRMDLNSHQLEVHPEVAEDDSTGLHMPIWRAYFPILLPIVLIALGTTSKLMELQGVWGSLLNFLGNPLVALLISVLLGYSILGLSSSKEYQSMITNGVKAAGPVLIITGAGGAFGSILKASSMADNLESFMQSFEGSSLTLVLIAFVLAAILKTSQGSSTSAIVITSSMLAPILPIVGITQPFDIALVVMAIGAGAMTLSHANDSYFWVVSQFGGLSVREAYRSYTVVTLIQGITTLLIVVGLSVLV